MKKIPHNLQPFLFFVTQFFCFALIIINTRAYNRDKYVLTVVTDLFFGAYGWFVIKAIGDCKHRWGWVGYTLGGATGSVFGIWFSNQIGS